MLSEKPWRGEAVMRLVLGVILYVMLGSTLTTVIGFFRLPSHPAPWLFGPLAGGAALFSIIALRLLLRPWNPDSLTRDLGIFLAFLYLGLVLGMFALRYVKPDPNDYSAWRITINALSLQGSAILLTLPFVREHGLKWSAAFGISLRPWRAIAWGVAVIVIVTPTMLAWQALSIELLTIAGRATEPQAAVQALSESQSWQDTLALGIVAIVLAPISEEIVFRGILYPLVKRLGYPRLALWGTALLFAAIHANLTIFLPILALALALTLLYEQTDNLLAPIAAHSLFNAYNFGRFYLGDNPVHWLRLIHERI